MGYSYPVMVLEVSIYVNERGVAPFIIWLEALDSTIRYRIKERLDRLRLGNFGDCKALQERVFELRCHFGSGYRVYYGIDQGVVVILCAGDKRTQKRDVVKAAEYWKDYYEKDN